MNRARYLTLFVFTAVNLFIATSVMAQGATLSGVVTDKVGGVVPGARVTFWLDRKAKFETYTDDEGVYAISLDEGRYDIEISWRDIMSFELKGFLISGNGVMKFDAVLACLRCGEAEPDLPLLPDLVPVELGQSVIPDRIYSRPLPLPPATKLTYTSRKKRKNYR